MRMGKLAVWAYTLHFLLFLVPGISAAGTGNAASAQQFVQISTINIFRWWAAIIKETLDS